MNKLVIGDIHGDYLKLQQLLTLREIKRVKGVWENPLNYQLIFLGDLNDPRRNLNDNTPMSSYTVLTWAKELCEQWGSICVRSNHQKNLIRLYQGKRKDVSSSLLLTNYELKTKPVNKVEEIINWLDTLPYYYSFKVEGITYYCVHAYYVEGMDQYNPNSKQKEAAQYGLRIKGTNQRDYWWKTPEQYVSANSVIIAGHYHLEYYSSKAYIIDGNCGSTDGRLIGLDFQERDVSILRV
jgi:predicted phosphodiesterase